MMEPHRIPTDTDWFSLPKFRWLFFNGRRDRKDPGEQNALVFNRPEGMGTARLRAAER